MARENVNTKAFRQALKDQEFSWQPEKYQRWTVEAGSREQDMQRY
jgi:hypothetical protein